MKSARVIVAAWILGASLLLGGGSALAQIPQIPQKLNYQGFITNATGTPLDAPGGVSMTFALFAGLTGGAALYSETLTVPVNKGVFNAVIGSVAPLTLAFDVEYFIEVTVGAETLTPRKPLASSAYALKSGCIPGDRIGCFDAPAGAPGVNNCQAGTRICNAEGTGWSACAGEVVPCGGGTVCCAAPQTCGGGGVPNQCGCTPTTCFLLGRNCGPVGNGCGGLLNCGTCSGTQVCGSVTPGVCGPPPPICGNGVIDPGEQCDGADLAGQTCQTFGFSSGVLACSVSCTFNTSGCTP